jgi:uncharacterized protein (TIGR02594 family)
MLEFSVFRRPLAALAFCSAAVTISASPAAARSHHGAHRYAHAGYRSHGAGNFAEPHYTAQPYSPEGISYQQVMPHSQVASYPRFAPRQHAHHPRIAQVYRRRMSRQAALSRLRQYAHAQASVTPYEPGGGIDMTGSSSSLVMEARHYLGTNPTARRSLWCARFMNMVLEHTGHRGTGSDLARSFASYGQRVSGPQVGAIAVMTRRGGGHVGVVSGVDSSGNPIIISGNHNDRVAEATYPRSRVIAYVMPN